MKTFAYSFLGVLCISLFLSSCVQEGNRDWTFTQDNSVSSELFQDVYKQVDETAQSDGSLKSCANVTLSDTLGNFPNTVTIEFDTAGCLGNDGRTRQGIIEAEFSGRWRDANTTVTITMTNYIVDNHLIEGTATITNNGTNAAGNISYTVTINNGQITDPNGNVMQWNGSTTYEWVAGQSTDFASNGLSGITDDVYHITGSANGVNRNGTPYTANITNHLVRDLSCKWITAGTIEVEPQNGDPRTIDFGTGDCDATVSFSFQQWSLNFILP